MVELAGGKSPPSWRGENDPPLAGESLVGVIRNNRSVDREYIFFRHIGHRALRVGKWKLVSVKHGSWELYDMDTDRSELNNLAAIRPFKVAEMADLWEHCHETFIQQSGTKRD